MGPVPAGPEQYVVKTVGALPLLRGFLKRAGLTTVIDRQLPKDPQAFLSVGEVAELLVANRLCSPRPLYHVEQWAQGAGVEQVFGVNPDWLNDDRLCRTLDRLAENAQTLKGEICLSLVERFGIELARFHYDLTTVWLQGEYEEEEPEAIRILYTKENPWQVAGKGFRLGISTFDDGRGSISLAYQALDGTEQTVAAALENLEELRLVLGQRLDRLLQVTDRAGVKAEVIATAAREGVYVLGPLAMNSVLERKVRELLAKDPPWQPMSYVSVRQQKKPAAEQDRYRAFEVPHEFEYEPPHPKGEKPHERRRYPARLLVIASDGKRKRDEKSRLKHQRRIEEQLTQARSKPGPASKIRQKVEGILRHYDEGTFYDVTWQGPPDAPTGFEWRLAPERVEHARVMEGVYVAATTLPAEGNSLDTVFTRLKQQWRVEDSHRLLKGPLRISPVFLHSPKRIEGLIFILWLALVTYQLLEREWRSRAQDQKMAAWTTRTLLALFDGYSYVGVQRDAHPEPHWVPCVLEPVHRLVYSALQVSPPNTS